MKLTPEQKEDNRFRRMFEREFRNYNLNFARFPDACDSDGIRGYTTYEAELCYINYHSEYTKGKKA